MSDGEGEGAAACDENTDGGDSSLILTGGSPAADGKLAIIDDESAADDDCGDGGCRLCRGDRCRRNSPSVCLQHPSKNKSKVKFS
jgi:hypothetical protein